MTTGCRVLKTCCDARRAPCGPARRTRGRGGRWWAGSSRAGCGRAPGSGPGICRKWRPVGWESSVSMARTSFRGSSQFCIQNAMSSLDCDYPLDNQRPCACGPCILHSKCIRTIHGRSDRNLATRAARPGGVAAAHDADRRAASRPAPSSTSASCASSCASRARRCARRSSCWRRRGWSTCCPTAARWPSS